MGDPIYLHLLVPTGWREFIRALWRSHFFHLASPYGLTSFGYMELGSEQNPI